MLVEDDQEIAVHIIDALETRGHVVETVHDGAEGLERAMTGDYTALIVDRMLSSMDGLTIVKRLRSEGYMTPVLFLTTMTGLNDCVEGLEGGADDYLVKPIAISELLARLNGITRRASGGEPTKLRVADLEVDLIRHTATRAGKLIDLQAQEFRLLEYLMRNAGQVVTRAMLLENVWDLHFDPRTNIVETHMSRLRSKVDRGFELELIRTVRGTGYVLRTN